VLGDWPGYWLGARKLHLVEFRGIAAEEDRVEALKGGGADLVTQLSPAGAAGLDGPGQAELWPIASNLCVIYMMNMDTEYLKDPRMRRALNYAVDKHAIIAEILLGHGEVSNGPLSRLHQGCDPEVKPYEHDPVQARKLVAEAGLQGLEVLIHSPLSLPEEAPRLSEMLVSQFRGIGLEPRIEMHEDRYEYARSIAEKKFQGLCCFDSSPLSTFRVLREKLDSRFRGPWWQGYHSDVANRLLSRAAATAANEARRKLYWEVYNLYRDDAPWLYLYQPRRLWGVRKGARDLVRVNREAVLRFV
jgi:peptide/nickel transport system substrate-binding protein